MAETAVRREGRAFLSAIGFLTRVRVPAGPADTWRADLARAPRYFPLVGGLIGALTGLAFWACCHVVPVPLAAALALVFEALLTGAFHEDALADYCDAFGGGQTSARVLEILKDSRLGSYGALGLGLGVLVRWSAMAALPLGLIIPACMAAGAIGRFGAVLAMRLLPPAPARESLSKDVGARISDRAVVFSTGLAVLASVPALLVAPVAVFVGIGLAVLPLAYICRAMKRVAGGAVGDGLGAITYIAQALCLVAFAARP
ncbi:MAG: adenosylcobinamide-GDP ribazoletransferase [Alphaproteobacteria bacterium]|nr:adenosylcobinamide-GDP ribazoletransferase [Alphaproteobacteria bacterium]